MRAKMTRRPDTCPLLYTMTQQGVPVIESTACFPPEHVSSRDPTVKHPTSWPRHGDQGDIARPRRKDQDLANAVASTCMLQLAPFAGHDNATMPPSPASDTPTVLYSSGSGVDENQTVSPAARNGPTKDSLHAWRSSAWGSGASLPAYRGLSAVPISLNNTPTPSGRSSPAPEVGAPVSSSSSLHVYSAACIGMPAPTIAAGLGMITAAAPSASGIALPSAASGLTQDLQLAQLLTSCAEDGGVSTSAHVLETLLGFQPEDHGDLLAALAMSGCSYVDLVAAYLHNKRIVAEDAAASLQPAASLAADMPSTVARSSGTGNRQPIRHTGTPLPPRPPSHPGASAVNRAGAPLAATDPGVQAFTALLVPLNSQTHDVGPSLLTAQDVIGCPTDHVRPMLAQYRRASNSTGGNTGPRHQAPRANHQACASRNSVALNPLAKQLPQQFIGHKTPAYATAAANQQQWQHEAAALQYMHQAQTSAPLMQQFPPLFLPYCLPPAQHPFVPPARVLPCDYSMLPGQMAARGPNAGGLLFKGHPNLMFQH